MHSIILFLIISQAQSFDHIYIVHTNDIEGGLSPSTAWWMNPYFPPPLGNAAAAATLIREKRAEADSLGYGFLLVDAGDMFVGSPVGEFSKGKAVAEYFNYCGYDIISPGNHDYDQGVEVFREFVESVNATVLGSNIVYTETGSVVDYLEPYTVLDVNGLRVGVFSLLTENMAGMTTPERFAGHSVLPETVVAARYVDTLKAKDVDLIVAITGIGLRHDKRLASTIPGIDVIIGSHSATALEQPYEDPQNHTVICQAYGHLSSIGFLDLWIDPQTKRLAGYHGELIDLLSEEIDDDTAMLSIVEKWEEITQKDFDVVIGYSRRELTRAGFEETTIGNLITDAMREFLQVDIAIHNSGGIRANLPEGDVTYRHCYNIDALSNTAVTMDMTGRQVVEMLEVGVNGHHAIFQVSGLKFTYDSKRPIGSRVIEVTLEDGTPIDPEARYSLVTNSFLAAGGGDYVIFKSAENIDDSFHYLRNIIAEYIKKHSPIEGRVEGRIIDLARR